MADEMSDEQIIEARRLADDIFETMIIPHEREDHDGDPCIVNRLGTIAFFAHVVGMKVEHVPMLIAMLMEYEQQHEHRNNGHGHGS